MNHNKNVVVFTLLTTFLLFLYSYVATIAHTNFLGLNNVSILSDILTERTDSILQAAAAMPEDTAAKKKDKPADKPLASTVKGEKDLTLYTLPKTIVNFSTDTALPALPDLMQKMLAIKRNKKGKVRIAWFGDSMIEGDLLSQTFRRRMQQYFGAYGVGFVSATSVTAGFRTTVAHKWKGDWKEESFKTKDLSVPLFLSGHTFFTGNGELELKDMTFKDTTQQIEKALLCGPVHGGMVNITVNGQQRQYKADKPLNRLTLDTSASHNISIGIRNDKLPVYGVSLEPQSGVVVDNFSFRGITGLELGKLDTNFLKSLENENFYDLVILEYGANLMFRPDDVDYSWYQKHILPVVRKLQKAMPHTEFLIVSTADRAFLYGDKWKSATGIENLVKIQATLAYNNNAAFYNMYASMGGAGTIVSWADATPPLANKDYIHPNHKGAETLGNMLFDAFIKDFQKLRGAPAPPPPPAPKAAGPTAIDSAYTVTTCNTIVDKKSNLEWYIADDKDYTWTEAKEWAEHLQVCNGGWGLPSAAQLLSLHKPALRAGKGVIINGQKFYARMSPVFGRIGHSSWVWTKENIDEANANTVNLNQGLKALSPKKAASYPIRAFAVRKLNAPKPGL